MIDVPKRLTRRVLAPLAGASFLLLTLAGCGTEPTPLEPPRERPTQVEDDNGSADSAEIPESTPEAEPGDGPDSPGEQDRERDRPDPELPAPELPERPEVPDPELPEPEQESDPVNPDGSTDHQAVHRYAELERATINSTLEYFEGVYSDIAVEVKDAHGIEYIYTFSFDVDIEQVRAELQRSGPELDELSAAVVFPDMAAEGVPSPIENTYTYLNIDGTEVWSHTVSE